MAICVRLLGWALEPELAAGSQAAELLHWLLGWLVMAQVIVTLQQC